MDSDFVQQTGVEELLAQICAAGHEVVDAVRGHGHG